jgi:hypothetical protein
MLGWLQAYSHHNAAQLFKRMLELDMKKILRFDAWQQQQQQQQIHIYSRCLEDEYM